MLFETICCVSFCILVMLQIRFSVLPNFAVKSMFLKIGDTTYCLSRKAPCGGRLSALLHSLPRTIIHLKSKITLKLIVFLHFISYNISYCIKQFYSGCPERYSLFRQHTFPASPMPLVF